MNMRFCITTFALVILLTTCQQSATPPVDQDETLSVTLTESVPLATTTSQATPTVLVEQSSPSPTSVVFENLDHDENWQVFTEGSPEWFVGSISTPSLDGKALRCSITGGSPYSNVHCYRNLLSEPTAKSFTLTLSFWFSPKTTCANRGETSIVQALEFTMNKWHESQRYEFALQWQNVGDGAPQWRYWDPHAEEKWLHLNPKIQECLEGERWHTIMLQGVIDDEQVFYKSFTLNHKKHQLDLVVRPASAPGEIDRLAVAVQLDGNANQTPYDMYIDKVTFVAQTVAP